jgi:hypothetical protein
MQQQAALFDCPIRVRQCCAMSKNTGRFRLASWLALAAMAFNALWPLLANARPAGQVAIFEVCTAVGTTPVAGDAGTVPAEGGERHLAPHCALCSTGTDKAPAAAQGTPLILAGAISTAERPHASFLDPVSTQPRSAAQPRAPPRIS